MTNGNVEFALSTKVTFGSGELDELGEEIPRCGSERAVKGLHVKANRRMTSTEEIETLYCQAFIAV